MKGAKNREEYQKFYDNMAAAEKYTNQHIDERWARVTAQLKYFKGGICFEAGTQSGGVTKVLAERCDVVTTCDISSTYLARAKEFLKDKSNVIYIKGFVEDILLRYPSHFDIIVMNEILEHVMDDKLVVDLAFEALKKDGLMVFSMPLEEIFPDNVKEHARGYTVASVVKLLKPYKHELCIVPVECPLTIVGAAWKVESKKIKFINGMNI